MVKAAVSGWIRFGGLLEATIALVLLGGTYALLDLTPSVPLLVAAFLGTFSVYLADRGLGFSPEDALNNPDRVRWRTRYRHAIWVALFAAGGATLLTLPMLSVETLLMSGSIGTAAVAYVAPVLPGGKRLKALVPVRSSLVAGAWAIGAVVLPVFEAGGSLQWSVAGLFLYRMCYLLPNVLICSWVDRWGDGQAGLSKAGGKGYGLLVILAPLLAIAGGVGALSAGWAPALLAVDLFGPVLLLVWILAGRAGTLPSFRFGLDLLMAWPAFTFLAWIIDFS